MAQRAGGNAEAVVYDIAPFFNYFQRERQQKKLENQALDKQITDDLAKYTPEGLRQQDVPKFLNEYQNLKNLSLQYRDAIRNPAKNPKVWNEYQTAKTKLMGLIAESKAAKENTKALYDFRAHNLDKLDDDAFKQAMLLYNAPVGTPEFDQAKGFDQSQLVFKPEKFDIQKWQTLLSSAVKPVDKTSTQELPTGQTRISKIQRIDPLDLSATVSQAFEADLGNAKKYYTTQFQNVDEAQKAELEGYASQYLPGFKINDAKDFAVATNLYGQVERDMGSTIGGSPYLANQAFQRAQQSRSFAQQDAAAERSAQRKDKEKYLWETDIEAALKAGDTKKIIKLYTELESSSPGVDKVYIKEGLSPAGALEIYKKQLKINGVDRKTRFLNPEDYKKGILVVAVPKVDKDKNILKGQYEYMAVSANDPFIQNRLNKLKNYAIGSAIKPLSDKIYEKTPEQEPLYQFNVLDAPVNNEEEQ